MHIVQWQYIIQCYGVSYENSKLEQCSSSLRTELQKQQEISQSRVYSLQVSVCVRVCRFKVCMCVGACLCVCVCVRACVKFLEHTGKAYIGIRLHWEGDMNDYS